MKSTAVHHLNNAPQPLATRADGDLKTLPLADAEKTLQSLFTGRCLARARG
jgi:hypothetical protein